jgi:hypothetical protein
MAESVNYEQIEHLVEDVQISGKKVYVTFKDAKTGETFRAEGDLPGGRLTEMKDAAKAQAAHEVKYGIWRALMGGIGKLLGRGAAGRIGAAAAYNAVDGMEIGASSNEPSDKQKQAAAIAIFDTVDSRFELNAETQKYSLKAEVQTEPDEA